MQSDYLYWLFLENSLTLSYIYFLFVSISDNPKYISSLGQTILNVSRLVPDGLLVFFPSYPLLNQCQNSWQASGLWADICRQKQIFVEPRNKEAFTTTMEEFYQNIRDLKGACFMAVCRGKVSEGLDFADRNGRAVIITGLPFPPMKDPKVILKKRYLDDNRTKENQVGIFEVINRTYILSYWYFQCIAANRSSMVRLGCDTCCQSSNWSCHSSSQWLWCNFIVWCALSTAVADAATF